MYSACRLRRMRRFRLRRSSTGSTPPWIAYLDGRKITMKRQGLFAFAAAGVIIGGAWLITASAIRAQQPPAAPAAPAAPPAQAVPPIGPADPNLQIVPIPDGKKVHLLPATLETTQWGWFNNAQ